MLHDKVHEGVTIKTAVWVKKRIVIDELQGEEQFGLIAHLVVRDSQVVRLN